MPSLYFNANEQRLRRWLVFLLLLGVALRIWEAVESSLWLDEAHSLFHASQPDTAAVLDAVQRDFHAPLFFVGLHWLGVSFESGAWARWVTIVLSLLALWPILRLLRGTPNGASSAGLAAALLLFFPYQVHYGAELRPYALLMLASTALCWAAFSEGCTKEARLIVFLLAALCGTLTHRVMVIEIFAIGVARLCVRRPQWLPLWKLVVAGALAAVPTLIWLARFVQWSAEQRDEHVAAAGEQAMRQQLLLELRDLPLRLVMPYGGSLGEPWAPLSLAGLALFGFALIALIVLGIARRKQSRHFPPALKACAIWGATAFAVIAISSVWSWDRVPLQYFAGVAWVVPVLIAGWVACLPKGPLVRPLSAALVVGALAMGVALAAGRSREDFRGAVELALRWGAELAQRDSASPPIYSAVLGQPGGVFPHDLPYRIYAPDLGAVEPDALPVRGSAGFARPLVVIRRALPTEDWKRFVNDRREVRKQQVHERVWVYELAPSE